MSWLQVRSLNKRRAAPGDANNLIESNTVSVATTANASSLLQAEVVPVVFTPNADRVNDVANISYDLLEIIGVATATITINDLAGRQVKKIYSGQQSIGHYERQWDGRDDSGSLVPPGIYLYRISLDTDAGKEEKVSTLSVVY